MSQPQRPRPAKLCGKPYADETTGSQRLVPWATNFRPSVLVVEAKVKHKAEPYATYTGWRVCHLPRVKSGNFCGAPPLATLASLSGMGALQAAAS